MNGRKAVVGLCMLCALLVSAFAAQNASAITGTTVFTCVQGGGDKALRGEHCLTTGTKPQEYGHVAIAQDETTEVMSTNAKSLFNTTAPHILRMKFAIGGVPLEFSAKDVTASGWMENKLAANGEHYVHGKGTITFTGANVSVPGCKITTDNAGTEGEAGVVHTRELTATTEGQGDFLKIQAADGGNIVTFWVTCESGRPGIEGKWSCNGSVIGVPNGATASFTHAETTNTLKCTGTKYGIEVSATMSARAKGSAGAYMPLAATTVTT